MTVRPPGGPANPERTLSVSADLRLEVDGREAHLSGDGQRLVLRTEDPLRLWSALGDASLPAGATAPTGPRAIGRLATLLKDFGVTLDIAGPGGTVVRLGSEARSPVGRLVTGSRAVQPGSVGALWPLARRVVVQQRRWVVAVGAVAAVGVAVRRLAR